MRRRFGIVAVPDPQTLPRILGIFSQRALIPATLSAELRRGLLHIETALDDLDASTAAMIAAKLHESVLVASVVCESAEAQHNARDAPRADIVTAA